MNITVRKGTIDDLPQVLKLVQELADFERAPQEVTNTLEDMRRDGFGQEPIFKFFVAESEEEGIVGLSLYYTAYSTWKGKTIYLEDLVVTEHLRRSGIGRQLFNAVAQEAKEVGAKRFAWQVLEWNEPAIAFYKKIGASLDGEWYNCRMTEEQIKAYSA
ncbi:GNAT family N-acetyltransferase [Pontibacter sp. SGAir0037]|uniref:GNAT family N-acetyltransferase n=1 Tax=Pontibacter sp. SGAir0037 TaxID=2571030 RepID=UPI0010CD1947|nr:GNAT family N-acetyltransferase [Pontibacter sp. SGAir0037]QCR24172.1 GNAT family N-acetyltransferase [Pontibacter sp. SGAir0037]